MSLGKPLLITIAYITTDSPMNKIPKMDASRNYSILNWRDAKETQSSQIKCSSLLSTED